MVVYKDGVGGNSVVVVLYRDSVVVQECCRCCKYMLSIALLLFSLCFLISLLLSPLLFPFLHTPLPPSPMLSGYPVAPPLMKKVLQVVDTALQQPSMHGGSISSILTALSHVGYWPGPKAADHVLRVVEDEVSRLAEDPERVRTYGGQLLTVGGVGGWWCG